MRNWRDTLQEHNQVLQELDFQSLKETDVERLVTALKALSVLKQAEIKAELQD